MKKAIVKISIAPIYEKPSHCAELGTQATMGVIVNILDEKEDWFQIQTPDAYVAWCEKDCFFIPTTIIDYQEQSKLVFTSRYGLAYFDQNLSITATDLCVGCILVWHEKMDNYYKAALPDGQIVYVHQHDVLEYHKWQDTRVLSQSEIIKTSLQYLGTPYLWGGTASVGLDCSGFTKLVYAQHGIGLKRNASQQCLSGLNIDVISDFKSLEPCDLIFFARDLSEEGRTKITHVGIYLGNNQYIHASVMVRIHSLEPSDPNYHLRALRLVRACRIIGHLETQGIYFL